MTDKHTNLDFSEALFLLKQGYRVSREVWSSGLGWIEHSKEEGRDVLERRQAGSRLRTLYCSTQQDLLANDWYVVLNEAA